MLQRLNLALKINAGLAVKRGLCWMKIEKFQQNASKFAIFYILQKPKVAFSIFFRIRPLDLCLKSIYVYEPYSYLNIQLWFFFAEITLKVRKKTYIVSSQFSRSRT